MERRRKDFRGGELLRLSSANTICEEFMAEQMMKNNEIYGHCL